MAAERDRKARKVAENAKEVVGLLANLQREEGNRAQVFADILENPQAAEGNRYAEIFADVLANPEPADGSRFAQVIADLTTDSQAAQPNPPLEKPELKPEHSKKLAQAIENYLDTNNVDLRPTNRFKTIDKMCDYFVERKVIPDPKKESDVRQKIILAVLIKDQISQAISERIQRSRPVVLTREQSETLADAIEKYLDKYVDLRRTETLPLPIDMVDYFIKHKMFVMPPIPFSAREPIVDAMKTQIEDTLKQKRKEMRKGPNDNFEKKDDDTLEVGDEPFSADALRQHLERTTLRPREEIEEENSFEWVDWEGENESDPSVQRQG